MTNNYFCPHCRSNMNIGNSLVFSAKSPQNERGLIFLDTELGNYTKRTHADFQLREGVEYKFYCPVCHESLVTDEADGLCAIDMQSSGDAHRVFFSPVAGEKATFVISAEGMRTTYGNDFKKYLREVGWGPRTV